MNCERLAQSWSDTSTTARVTLILRALSSTHTSTVSSLAQQVGSSPGGLARFRSIRTVEHLRRRGVATSMIHFIQQQPQVREQDGLVIFCDTEDTIHLYERLGFVRHGYLWALFRPL